MTKAELISVLFTANEQANGYHVARARRLRKSYCEKVRAMYEELPNSRTSAKNKTRSYFEANAKNNKY